MGKKTLIFVMVVLLVALAITNALAVVFPVFIPADAGPGTLRDAIMLANGTPGNDLIVFAMPPGPQTIIPLSPLPPLTDPMGVTIDGFTQAPGGSCGPMPPASTISFIQISGFAAGPSQGLWIMSDNNVIQGLIINNFQQDGILIEGGVANPSANSNLVTCCFIGTDPSGTVDMGNGTNLATLYAGVRIAKTVAGIPAVTLGNRVIGCLLSGNYADGASVWGPTVPGDVGFNAIMNNFIGTDRSGTVDLGNDNEGVSLVEGTHDNMIDGNLISGNDYDGVGIQGFNNFPFGPPILTVANNVSNNIIGLDISLNPLPNSMHGVAVGTYGPAFWGCALANTIGPNNRIARNGMDGVYVWEDPIDVFNGDRNLITQNSIYDNLGLGIDLHFNGVTPNDPGDPDVLANEEMNFPVIDSAKIFGGITTFFGRLDTPVPNTATVEVFKAKLDPSGHGEGAVYLGSTNPLATGNWTFSAPGLVSGDSATATAYDAAKNTSEFSRTVLVTCCRGIRGDVNYDGADANILDLTFTVDRVFRGGPPAPCPGEGDVNGDGTPTNILDLTFLVDRIFRGGPLPGPCL